MIREGYNIKYKTKIWQQKKQKLKVRTNFKHRNQNGNLTLLTYFGFVPILIRRQAFESRSDFWMDFPTEREVC